MRPFDLAVNQWWQVPRVGNSRLADVYSPLGGPELMTAWGGACVDTKRHDLLVAGGGHADLTDNAVYAFNVDTLVWRRKVSSSSVAANDDSEVNADGSPASRHTYNTLLYDVGLDKFMMFPGGFLAGPGGVRSIRTYGLDCTTESPSAASPSSWTRYDDDLNATLGNARASAAYDPATAKYYVQFGTGFGSFDPTLGAGSQWVELTSFEGPNTSDNTVEMALLSPNQMVWVNTADNGELWARFLTNPWSYVGSEANGIGATGAIDILDVANPGMRWEPNLRSLVLWGGLAVNGHDRRDVYQVNSQYRTVTKVEGFGDVPDAPQTNGTFGRWSYLGGCGPQYFGLWVLVNSTTSDVFFYRSSDRSPVSGVSPAWPSRLGA